MATLQSSIDLKNKSVKPAPSGERVDKTIANF